MNSETAQTTPFPTSTDTGLNGNGRDNNLHAFTQKIHEAVDSLEQRIGQSSEKVMGLQEEYGNMAREQVRANPLAALGVAFAAGFILAKLFR